MKRLVSILALSLFVALPVFAKSDPSAPQKGEVEEIASDTFYYFTIGRLDKSTLVSTNVFEDNLAYFLGHHKDLRVQSFTAELGPAEGACAVPGRPMPGRTVGYWLLFRNALPNEPKQKLEYYEWSPDLESEARTILKIFPSKAKKIVTFAPLNSGDGGALSGYYVVFTDK